MIYFIKPIGMEGPIKIGVSVDTEARCAQLAHWSPFPLEVVLTIPGDRATEKALHDQFADDHSHGEWFHASPQLLRFMAETKAGVPVTPTTREPTWLPVHYLTHIATRIRNGTENNRPRIKPEHVALVKARQRRSAAEAA